MSNNIPADFELRDSLTGIFSRATFDLQFEQAILRADRYPESFALLFLDLDHFKSINDAMGHARGDAVLRELGQRLRETVRASDLPYRYGGDEFVILLPHTSKPAALTIAQRLLAVIHDHPFSGDPPVHLSASIGIAVFPEDGRETDALFAVADRRLYQSKHAGRGQIAADDLVASELPGASDVTRLIERDQALWQLRHFLDAFSIHPRQVLYIIGPPGCGHSRLLAELDAAARARGWHCFTIRGSLALQKRRLGAVLEASRSDPSLPAPNQGAQVFAQALWARVINESRVGLLLIVINWPLLDPASRDWVQQLAQNETLTRLGVAYTDDETSGPAEFQAKFVHSQVIPLAPLSSEGVRVWVRQSLRWEPPAELIHWLWRETQGRPARIRRALAYLIDHDILSLIAGQWRLRSDFAATPLADHLAQLDLPPHSLPISTDEFVGRAAELVQVKSLLRQTRIVTITGPGGTGKSRLALQVAGELLETGDYGDGVFFVGLAAVHTAEQALSALVEALNLYHADNRLPKTQVVDHLREKHLLLVIDNVEHLPTITPLLAELLEQAPYVSILLTSRNRLQLLNSSLCELHGLPYPEKTDPSPADSYSAVELFVQRARRVQPTFTLTPENQSAVVRICHLVSGLPLGIEIAAAWVSTFSCERIAAEIEHNLEFLQSPAQRKADPRNLTNDSFERESLYGVLHSFWSLLSASERSMLSKLAVFENGFERDDAVVVTHVSPFFLDSLTLKAHLHQDPTGRYSLPEVIRSYVGTHLAAQPRLKDSVRRRHYNHYLKFLKQHTVRLIENQADLQSIHREWANVRAAWEGAVTKQDWPQLASAATGLFHFCEQLGMWSECGTLFGLATECLAEALASSSATSPRPQRWLIQWQVYRAESLLWQAQYPDALPVAEAARQHAHLLPDAELEVAALNVLGGIHFWQGNYQEAEACLAPALTLARKTRQAREIVQALNWLGRILGKRGKYMDAQAYLREALTLARKLGDQVMITHSLNNLANTVVLTEDYDEAIALYQEALQGFRLKGDRFGEGIILNNLGVLAHDLHRFDEAEQYYRQALHVNQAIAARRGIALNQLNLGEVAREHGDYPQALHAFGLALSMARQIGEEHLAASIQASQGAAYAAMHKIDQAQRAYQEALALAVKMDATTLVLWILVGWADLEAQTGQGESAAASLGFVIHHPAYNADIKLAAETLLARLQVSLPETDLKRWLAQGQTLRLEGLVQPILARAD